MKILKSFALCLKRVGSRFRQMRRANDDDDVVELGSRVKCDAGVADRTALPPVGLEKWLDTQAGTDAAIAGVVRTADDPGRGISFGEAGIHLTDVLHWSS